MHYDRITKGVFLERPNRFIARIELDGREVVAHVKNTGRCKELLIPGTMVYVQQAESSNRKTAYDLIAVEKGQRLVNIDAQAPNRVFREWAVEGRFQPMLTLLKPEAVFHHSRLDFYWEAADGKRGYVEVKGVTLEEGGAAFFPDAPTERGVRHVEELMLAVRQGHEAALFFVIQTQGISRFSPNDKTHPAFGAALRQARSEGVYLAAYDCITHPQSLSINAQVPIIL